MGRDRHIVLAIDVAGAGNVAGRPAVAITLDPVFEFRVRDQHGRRVEDAEIGVIEMGRQPVGRDQKVGVQLRVGGVWHGSVTLPHCAFL